MKPLPHTPGLLAAARRIVWFKPPEEALDSPIELMAYAMKHATDRDMALLLHHIGMDGLREAIDNAPAGIIDARSWSYWNAKIGGFPHRRHRGAGWGRSHPHRLGTAEIAAPDARHQGALTRGLPMSRLTISRRTLSRPTCRRPAGVCLSVISLWLAVLLAAVAMAEPAAAQKRVALVIGNAAYTYAGRLPNPGNDATDMAAALKGLGIEVILGRDLDKPGFDAKLRQFSRALADADVGILFYAGHGLQVGLRNYLVPTDAQLQGERDLEFETVALDFVMRQMEIGREGRTNIVFLDACRDNPLARNLARAMGTRSVGVGRGLAEVQAGVGTFIAYATKPGEVAQDGDGRNSPFTAALAKAVKAPGKGLTAVMVDVRKEVLAATRNRQVPWDHSALTGEFYFQLAAAPGMLPKTPPPAPKAETEAMQERIRQLEEELKRKADPQLTVKLVEVSQIKERLRQLDEGIRQDQQLIFDTMNKRGSDTSAEARQSLSLEIGTIQRRMATRGQQQRALREQLAKLEEEVGAAKAGK